MFIQVITGKVKDREGLRRQVDRWESEVRPGATGFLGGTSGITEDGRLVVLARFESAEAAQRNSERPEQSAWWAETEKVIEAPEFRDSVDIITTLGGGSDEAGFVQVMRGRVVDADKARQLRERHTEVEAFMRKHRPDVLGDVVVVHADGTYTDAVYFTSKADARAGEAKDMPPEAMGDLGELMAAIEVDEYLDLEEPWLR